MPFCVPNTDHMAWAILLLLPVPSTTTSAAAAGCPLHWAGKSSMCSTPRSISPPRLGWMGGQTQDDRQTESSSCVGPNGGEHNPIIIFSVGKVLPKPLRSGCAPVGFGCWSRSAVPTSWLLHVLTPPGNNEVRLYF